YRPGASDRAGKPECEGLTVAAGPLGHDIIDDEPVVVVGQNVLCAGGADQVDSMHPGIPREDDIDEISARPAFAIVADQLGIGYRPAPHERGCPSAPVRGLRSYR